MTMLTEKKVLKYILSRKCEWVEGEYEGQKSLLTIRFECGHINQIRYVEFRRGVGCSKCAMLKRRDSHRTKESEVVSFLEKHGFKNIIFPEGIKTQKTSFVIYSCEMGHTTKRKIDKIFQYPTCNLCKRDYLSVIHKGENNHWWKGGTSDFVIFMRNQIGRWKNDSSRNCNHECVVTGDYFDDIHHLYPMSKILRDTLHELNMESFLSIEEYTDNEIDVILNKVLEIHYRHPLGVCLRHDIHVLFHSLYGLKDNTPEQFYDFLEKINTKEITL